MSQQINLAYQRVAVQDASAIGITILLYDRLVSDIQAAINWMQKGDIEKRCAAVNHGFLILQQLQCNLNMEEGGETAKSLEVFYLHLHCKLLEAQGKNSAQMLQEQIELILQVRSAWYQVESQGVSTLDQQLVTDAEPVQPSLTRRRSYNIEEHAVSNWSA
jgi:flagellar biosynthetic protein FliS